MSMTGYDVLSHLNAIAATKSRTEKEELLDRVKDDPLMLKVLRYAYDPFVTFGLTPPKCVGSGRLQLTAESPFWAVLDSMAARRVTGGEAQELVKEWMVDLLDESGSQVVWRVLSKDLRAGFTQNTINRVLPGCIPVFDVMLAHKYEEKRVVVFPCAVEPKLDGLRAIGLIKDASGGFFSRTGKRFPALDHLVEPAVEMLDRARAVVQNAGSAVEHGIKDEKLREIYWRLLGGNGGPCLALDSESVSGNFNKTAGDVRRKDEAATDTILNVFDALPYAVFTSDKTEIAMKYAARRRFTEFVVGCAAKDAPVALVRRYFANSHAEIQDYYQRFRDAGLEGAIVKPLDGVYQKKRSYGWLKMKGEIAEDIRVTGAFEGAGKYEGSLGGLICDFNGVEVRVGGGFSDAQRTEIWNAWLRDREKMAAEPELCHLPGELETVGRLIEVEAHEITPDGSLRHPRFLRWRDDKDDALKVAA